MRLSLFFSAMSLSLVLLWTLFPSLASIPVLLALFFFLGLPHGALDIVMGKEMLSGPMGKNWWIPFISIYLALSLSMIALWTLWPFIGFIIFMLISIQHFGLSDTIGHGPIRLLEGLTRGLIPLTTPAYFSSASFQNILTSTLTSQEAFIVTHALKLLFIPTLLLFLLLILYYSLQKKLSVVLELVSLLSVFIFLPPFQGFLIYFCFLHSIRHTLSISHETKKSYLNLMVEAFLPTLLSALWLIAMYYFLKEKGADLNTMYYLFFMGIAALTLPHMILVEGLSKLKKSESSP